MDKFDISEDFSIWAKDRRVCYPITTAKNWVPKRCLVCDDLTSELADISVGSEGSSVRWSTVIVRTREGEDVFSRVERAGVVEIHPVLNLENVQELAYRKREQGKYTRNAFKLKEQGLHRHEIAATLGISKEVSGRLRLSEEWWTYRLEGS